MRRPRATPHSITLSHDISNSRRYSTYDEFGLDITRSKMTRQADAGMMYRRPGVDFAELSEGLAASRPSQNLWQGAVFQFEGGRILAEHKVAHR